MSQKQVSLSPAQSKTSFMEMFKPLTLHRNYTEVWADFAELAAIAIHQSSYFNPAWMPTGQGFEEQLLPIDATFTALEAKYLSIVPKYEQDDLGRMAKLYGIAEKVVRQHRIDFLGPLHEELDLSGSAQRGRRGEFFTPPAIAAVVAQLTLTNVEDILQSKGYLTLQEPAVGAGGMVIAAANALEQMGHDPRQILRVEAIDVNRTFFNIAYFQIAAMDLPGTVWWGNTLSLDMKEGRETPHLKLSRFHWEKDPCFQMLKFLKGMENTEVNQQSSHMEEPEMQNHPSDKPSTVNSLPSDAIPSIPLLERVDKDGQLRLF